MTIQSTSAKSIKDTLGLVSKSTGMISDIFDTVTNTFSLANTYINNQKDIIEAEINANKANKLSNITVEAKVNQSIFENDLARTAKEIIEEKVSIAKQLESKNITQEHTKLMEQWLSK